MSQQGETYRTKCGNGRATYRPDWDAAKPWVCYHRGTAFQHAATLLDAQRFLKTKGCRT